MLMHRYLLSNFDNISLAVHNIGIHFKKSIFGFCEAGFLLINMAANPDETAIFVEVFRIGFQHL